MRGGTVYFDKHKSTTLFFFMNSKLDEDSKSQNGESWQKRIQDSTNLTPNNLKAMGPRRSARKSPGGPGTVSTGLAGEHHHSENIITITINIIFFPFFIQDLKVCQYICLIAYILIRKSFIKGGVWGSRKFQKRMT